MHKTTFPVRVCTQKRILIQQNSSPTLKSRSLHQDCSGTYSGIVHESWREIIPINIGGIFVLFHNEDLLGFKGNPLTTLLRNAFKPCCQNN